MMWKGLIVAAVPAVVLCFCKPAPAASRSQGPADSTIVGSQAPTGLTTSATKASEDRIATDRITGASSEPNEAVDTSIDARTFKCAPKVFSLRDSITLRMQVPHGEYLVVNQPNGTLFYLVYPQLGDTRQNYSLLPSDIFKQTPTIRFGANVKAEPRVYGRDTLEAVFHKPGNYVLVIGSNLESERGSGIHKCTIRLAG
jgi:hypothetical protein